MDSTTRIKRIMQLENIRAADMAGKTGTNEATIAEYLSGKKEPDAALNKLLSGATPLTLDDLWAAKFASLYETAEEKPAFIVYERLGEALRAARKQANMRQVEAADALRVRPEMVDAWEKGKKKIDLDMFYQACYLYCVQPAPLMRQAVRIPDVKVRTPVSLKGEPPAPPSEDFIDLLFEKAECHGVSIDELAQAANLQRQTVADLEGGHVIKPPLQTLLALFGGLLRILSGALLDMQQLQQQSEQDQPYAQEEPEEQEAQYAQEEQGEWEEQSAVGLSTQEQELLWCLRHIRPGIRETLYDLIEAMAAEERLPAPAPQSVPRYATGTYSGEEPEEGGIYG